MTWAAGSWSATAWAPDTWLGLTPGDADIPVAVVAAVFSALTATGQPALSARVDAEITASSALAPSISQTAQTQGNSASSISILGPLVTGWPVVSAASSSLAVAGQPNTSLQVRPTVEATMLAVGALNQSLSTRGDATCSLYLLDGPGVSAAFASTLPGSATLSGPVYLGWPVSATTTSASAVAGQLNMSVSPQAQSSPSLSTTMEWKLDQGLAGSLTGQASLMMQPTVSRGVTASISAAQGFASQVGVAYAAVGSIGCTSTLSGGLGTATQVAGAAHGGLNAYGLLNQSMQLRGSISSLLSSYWSNLPDALPTELVVVGDKLWTVVDGEGIAFKPPTRVLSATSLRFTGYSLTSAPTLTAKSARSWGFDSTNSEYIFEGNSHESYGTQGPGRGQDSELRLQPGDRGF